MKRLARLGSSSSPKVAAALFLLLQGGAAYGQPETQTILPPSLELPDPLTKPDGTRLTSAWDWPEQRERLLKIFESEVYGRSPRPPDEIEATVIEEGVAFGGLAARRQVRLTLVPGGPAVDLLLYRPGHHQHPSSSFVALNFLGNHSISDDPDVLLPSSWLRRHEEFSPEHRATEAGRGSRTSRWPVRTLLESGYGLVTAYYGDIDPDFDDGFQNGLHPHFYSEGQSLPADDEWGSIAAWAWGLSRIRDYLETTSDFDASRIVLFGHSRLGKAALWAAAIDTRFPAVISNNSGCGGAALSKRKMGETVAAINTRFPHWFAKNFHGYNDREADLPVDQHQLLALIAPRSLYVASASEDAWADPQGEFEAVAAAAPVFALLGEPAFQASEMPAADQPFIGSLSYHLRTGRHDVTLWDWERYIEFADLHIGSDAIDSP